MNEATREKAEKFFQLAADRLSYLYGRWQDEKEYKDFADYAKNAETFCKEQGVTFVKLSKKPFELLYTIDGIAMACRINAKFASWYTIGKTPEEPAKPAPEPEFKKPGKKAPVDLPADRLRTETDKKWKAYRPQIKGKLVHDRPLAKAEEAILATLTEPERKAFYEAVEAQKAKNIAQLKHV